MIAFDYNDFILNGFYKTKYPDIDNISISSVKFDVIAAGIHYPSIVSNEFTLQLTQLKDDIHKTLLRTFDTVKIIPRSPHLALNKYGVWDGTEASSTAWHNDYLESGTMIALVYFDSLPQDGSCGGALYITNNDGNYDCHAPRTNEIFQFVPQRGDVVFITHDRNIDHKVDYATIGPRRVMSIGIDCSFCGFVGE